MINFLLYLLADYGVDKYDIGTAFGHFGIAVEDVRFCYLSIVLSVQVRWTRTNTDTCDCKYELFLNEFLRQIIN